MTRALDLLAAMVAAAPTDATLLSESDVGPVLSTIYGVPEGEAPSPEVLEALDRDTRTLVQALGYVTAHEVNGQRVYRVTAIGRIYAQRIAAIDLSQPMPLGENPFGQSGVI